MAESHQTFIFFVFPSGEIRVVAQQSYARLLRGEIRLPEHAGEAVRVADWYAEVHTGKSPKVVNETYSVLQLDADGAVDWRRCRIGPGRNRALYEALRRSRYDDPDEDPDVRGLRAQLCDQVAWLPDSAERSTLQQLLEADERRR